MTKAHGKDEIMSNDPRNPYSSGDPEDATKGTPRWAYIFGAIAIIVVLLFVILLMVGGDHGSGRHTS